MKIKLIAKLVLNQAQLEGKGDASLRERFIENAELTAENGCDAIMISIQADDDRAHETAIDIIREICDAIDVPVIGADRIRRMEDAKKLFYAGCEMVALDENAVADSALLEEIFGKFGRERYCFLEERSGLAACVENPGIQVIVPVPEEAYTDESGSELKSVDMEATVRTLERGDVSGLVIGGADADIKDIREFLNDKGYELYGLKAEIKWESLKKNKDGLIPVIVQDYRTDEVLMLAYMNEEAFEKTIATGMMTYYSRSRKELWVKGLTSGHYQYVRSLTADCDLDTILAKVRQVGAACHTGRRSCFFNGIAARQYREKNPQKVLDSVYRVIEDRKKNPKEGSYTNYLFDKGLDKILKKCGEEATEIVIAAKNPGENEIIYEISDYLYHMMVLMVEKGVTWEEITDELARR